MGFNSPVENQQDVFKALTNVVGKAYKMKAPLEELKVIIFSDHHRGRNDGADDFSNSKAVYHKALKFYLKDDHQLILLGDVEEFWENTPKEVMRAHADTNELEAKYFDQNRYLRIWGNHDDA